MISAFKVILALCALLPSKSFMSTSVRSKHHERLSKLYEEPSQAPESYERNKDGSFSDRADVKDTLSQLMAVLGPLAPSKIEDGVVSQEKLIQDIEDGFSKILLGVRQSDMTPMEKRMIITEANMILSDMKTKEGVENLASNTYSKKNNRIYVTPAATVLFSARASPYLLVYGSGIIGQEMLKKMKQMGKSIELKVLDGDFLGIMSEKEIEVALRNVKTIIIAADSKKVESKGGWFGGGNKGSPVGSNNVEAININNNEWDQLLNEKSLKKLLNATMKECNNGGNSNIKIIAVGKATRQPKSISSFLGGENTEFDSEVILQCKQRGLGYSIVKVGTIIGDNVPLPSGLRDRDRSTGSGAGSGTALKLSSVELEVAQKEYNSPVLFAGSSSRVELGEVTRLSLAVDAVLRSATHPLMNSTTTVLSSPSPSSLDLLPSDAQWDDEFLRLDGPELERIPLRFSSVNQAVLRIGLIVEGLKSPSGGLVTPIDAERFENGVRILFRPLGSSYSSKNDERKNEKKEEAMPVKKIVSPQVPKNMGYLSPEQEKAEEEREEREKVKARLQEEDKKITAAAAAVPKKTNNVVKLEGGLEIIVDSLPYRRVRIRRCNMGAQTVVKEESEALIIKSIIRGLQVLENDYRIALMTSFKQ